MTPGGASLRTRRAWPVASFLAALLIGAFLGLTCAAGQHARCHRLTAAADPAAATYCIPQQRTAP